MPDIRLDKPAAGKVQNIPCGENARFVLGFPTGEAVVVRDGESLVMDFAEGGQLRFNDFYKNYGKGRLPSFVVDDTEINAKEFFTAMGEPELVPAMGPAGQASQTPSVADGARFHDWSGMETMTGLTHLSGLDLTLETAPYAFAERHIDPLAVGGGGVMKPRF